MRQKRIKAHLNAFHRCLILALTFPDGKSYGHVTIWYGTFVKDFQFHVTIYDGIDENQTVSIDCSSHFKLVRTAMQEFKVQPVAPDPEKPSAKQTCDAFPALAEKVEMLKSAFCELVQDLCDNHMDTTIEECH